ncbi:MAG: hypothetical protein ACKOHG_14400 [Planctomycetia bacterium]
MPHHHHSIHLGAAWETPAPSADGGTEWKRRFGRPAGIEPGDRVLLVVSQAEVAAVVTLNAVTLPPLPAGAGRWTHDVTPLLRDRNELVLAMTEPVPAVANDAAHGRGPLPAACGRVALEIVSADHHA